MAAVVALTARASTAGQSGIEPRLASIRSVTANTATDLQIALAESAGPPVAPDATILTLGPKGYVKVRDGRNGFTCLVERQRVDTLEPECYDAEGSATTLGVTMFIEEQRAAGVGEAAIDAAVEAGYREGRFKAPRKPGIVYMLSDYNYVYDPDRKAVIHFPGHLMFYAPFATEKEVGTGPGAPYVVSPGTPRTLLIVVPAGTHAHQ
jgi:hypothetical protein